MSFRKLNKSVQLNDVTASVNSNVLQLSGKHGTMSHKIPESINVNLEQNVMNFTKTREILSDDKKFIGTFISLLNSSIIGVKEMHESKIIFKGTGVSLKIENNQLEMKLGKSHKVYKDILTGLTCTIISSDVKHSVLSVKGVDKGLVTRFASELRIKRAYKGGVHVFIEGKEPRLKERKGA